MDKIKKFYNMILDQQTDMKLMVVGLKDRGLAANGSPYVTVDLFDGQKKVPVNFFDNTVETLAQVGFVENAIIDVKLRKTIGKSANKFYYNQEAWNLNTDKSISAADFVHMAPIDADTSFAWLMNQVKSVDSNPNSVGPYKSISYLTQKLLKENEGAFKRSTAAVTMHHNFLSGLLYHTIRMVSMAERSCETYRALNKELLICATALHDIGKVSCYNTKDSGESDITVEGRLLDHAVVGIMMIHDATQKDLYNPEKIQMLQHMLASHHGKKEWDAITTPSFPEAEMLHLIDMIDSRMNMFEEAYKGQLPGTLSEERVYGLENSFIYKPSFYEL